jgi:hypothetical protein
VPNCTRCRSTPRTASWAGAGGASSFSRSGSVWARVESASTTSSTTHRLAVLLEVTMEVPLRSSVTQRRFAAGRNKRCTASAMSSMP